MKRILFAAIFAAVSTSTMAQSVQYEAMVQQRDCSVLVQRIDIIFDARARKVPLQKALATVDFAYGPNSMFHSMTQAIYVNRQWGRKDFEREEFMRCMQSASY